MMKSIIVLSTCLLFTIHQAYSSVLRRSHKSSSFEQQKQQRKRSEQHKNDCNNDSDCSFPKGVCAENKCLCKSPFAGTTCQDTEKQLLCEPHCLNKGFCNPDTKECECTPDYVGKSCEIPCPKENNKVCGGNGECSLIKKNNGVLKSECFCQPGFTGETCSRKLCPSTSSGECNGLGKCDNGKCQCLESYTGNVCNIRECNIDCSGHGTCSLQTQSCKCNKGWFGKNCEFKVCPATRFGSCGGHGLCDESTGLCSCDENWTGGACHIPRCVAGTSVDCSGHGRCRGEKCHCKLGWAGVACEKQVCPMGCLSSAGRGKCLGGVCECAPGFVGKACESKEKVPISCGAPCQQKCINLPLADNSIEHCEQIKPIEIFPNGTYPKSTMALSLEDIKGNQFPGFKCYQMCYKKCVQSCFDQMHPFAKSEFISDRK